MRGGALEQLRRMAAILDGPAFNLLRAEGHVRPGKRSDEGAAFLALVVAIRGAIEEAEIVADQGPGG